MGSPAPCRPLQYGDVGQVLAALRNAALIAGTVLSADQTMGRAAALGSDIEIGPRSLDLFFHVATDPFGRLERPRLCHRARQEATERGAMLAGAPDAACA